MITCPWNWLQTNCWKYSKYLKAYTAKGTIAQIQSFKNTLGPLNFHGRRGGCENFRYVMKYKKGFRDSEPSNKQGQ